jgi:DNA-binding transcriptional MerR regulator
MRQYEDLLIDALLDHGFTVEEAQNLIRLQERVERERREEDRRRLSGGWLSGLSPRALRDRYN